MIPKTIFDIYSDFQASNTKVNKSTLRSVIHRFLAEHWGGEAPTGGKASNEEVFKLIELLKKLPATLLVGSMDILEKEFISQDIAKENSKSYKSAYKAFFKWAEVNNYFKEVDKQNLEPDIQQKIFTRQPKGSGIKRKTSYHNRVLKQSYTLMARNGHTGKLIYTTDYINNTLANELKLFESFRKERHNCSKGTIKKDIRQIYCILGWLHRHKGISLEDLSLSSIIKFIKLNVLRSDFKNKKGDVNYHKYLIKKAMVREEVIELANENKKLIEEYLDFLGGHPNSKLMIIKNSIAVAKFIFRDEIGIDEYRHDSNLPIVERLRDLLTIHNKNAKSSPPSVPYANKSVAWEKTFNILEVLRRRIHCLSSGVNSKRLRNQNAIINNLQMFLSLAFMVLIPTDRARTYYELEIGRTFVYGIYEANIDRFIPFDEIEDKSKAFWYIHLMPEDYKTRGKEYWGIMPNVRFDRDNDLYSYIDRWINEGREYRQKCNHNCFFRQTRNYKSLSHIDLSIRIRAIFVQESGIPVTPKELRKMYITYLNNIGATSTQLQGAADAMHHSRKMQETVYNSQTILEKVQPIYELNEKMHKEFFGSSDED